MKLHRRNIRVLGERSGDYESKRRKNRESRKPPDVEGRAICSVCNQSILLRGDGTIRQHPAGGVSCPGAIPVERYRAVLCDVHGEERCGNRREFPCGCPVPS